MYKTIYPLILAALLVGSLPAPSLAQAVQGGPALPSFIPAATTAALPSFLAGTSNAVTNTISGAASGAALSGGTTGVFGNTSAMTGAGPMGMGGLTSALTSQQSPRGLQQAGQGLLSPGSVNQSAFPSQQWSYGFPSGGTGVYQGVTGGSIGGFLPATSTSSVNLNTVDCPFLRQPTEGNGVGGGAGTGGGNINFGINLPGGINVNGSLNTQQAINGLQNFFGN
ncbi:MAG TPA: hypothetical protein V6C69_18955 [Trichormus sp.]|jgi:hypothetical protein